MICLSLVWIAARTSHLISWDTQTPLQEVQLQLGEEAPKHYIIPEPELVKMGEELVRFGRTIGPNGKRTKFH